MKYFKLIVAVSILFTATSCKDKQAAKKKNKPFYPNEALEKLVELKTELE